MVKHATDERRGPLVPGAPPGSAVPKDVRAANIGRVCHGEAVDVNGGSGNNVNVAANEVGLHRVVAKRGCGHARKNRIPRQGTNVDAAAFGASSPPRTWSRRVAYHSVAGQGDGASD